MLVTKQIEIDMGHRVPNHKSKCKNMHGHRYRIELGVDDQVIVDSGASDEGMVIDFGDLKEILKSVIEDEFDHRFLFYSQDELFNQMYDCIPRINTPEYGIICVNFIPTAENLAKYWYEILEENLQLRNIAIKYVKVWETPTSTATYE